MRSSVCFQCPHFHLSETLSTELGLTTKRLLCNQTVWTNGTLVDLIFHHVVQLHHVGVTHSCLVIKWLTGSSIKQLKLTVNCKAGIFQLSFNLLFSNSIQHRSSYAILQCIGSQTKVGFEQLSEVHTGDNTEW